MKGKKEKEMGACYTKRAVGTKETGRKMSDTAEGLRCTQMERSTWVSSVKARQRD